MNAVLRIVGLSVAGVGYIGLGMEHGGWYLLMLAHVLLEGLVLYRELRHREQPGNKDQGMATQ